MLIVQLKIWQEVSGEVLKGSIIGHMLLKFSITDLDKDVYDIVIKFTCDAELGRLAKIPDDKVKI